MNSSLSPARWILPAALLLGFPLQAQSSRPTSQPSAQPGAEDPLAREFKRLLPRGRIAAVFKPVYKGAAQAKIRPKAWILGIVIEGQAYAYSLNLLNRHEVVNDKRGKVAFAAVW